MKDAGDIDRCAPPTPSTNDTRAAPMHRNGLRPTFSAMALAALLLVVQGLDAQPAGGSYVLRKQAIGAGGASSAGPYRLTGTVAEVGAAVSAGPRFRLVGGFHGPRGPSGPIADSIFCDGFEALACP